jgi:chromosome segregation ATPase
MNNKAVPVAAVLLATVSIAVAVTIWQENGKLRRMAEDAREAAEAAANRPAPEPVEIVKVVPPKDAIDPQDLADAEAEVARLKVLIEDKDRRIADLSKDREAEREQRRAQAQANGGQQDWGARQNAWMERLKEEDPERHKEIQDRIANFNKRLKDANMEQSEFFASLDTEAMTEEQLESHNKLVELQAKLDEINDLMAGAPENGEDVNALRMDMFMTMREMRPLYESEREVALQDLGQDIGYNQEESKEFANYVDYVYDMTSSSMRRAWHGNSTGTTTNADGTKTGTSTGGAALRGGGLGIGGRPGGAAGGGQTTPAK